MKSVLQDRVMELGLRHQGVLLTAVRGCDTAPKDDPSKLFCRMLRGTFLVCHCGDATKAQSFIEDPFTYKLGLLSPNPVSDLRERFTAFRKNCDHYPHHYVMHIIHAIQIIGFYHPDPRLKGTFLEFYCVLCKGLHTKPEWKDDMDVRLNADEDTFGKLQSGEEHSTSGS